jgi:hypothetical protein
MAFELRFWKTWAISCMIEPSPRGCPWRNLQQIGCWSFHKILFMPNLLLICGVRMVPEMRHACNWQLEYAIRWAWYKHNHKKLSRGVESNFENCEVPPIKETSRLVHPWIIGRCALTLLVLKSSKELGFCPQQKTWTIYIKCCTSCPRDIWCIG